MNSGPLIFLGTFFAMSVSWLGFVLAPQLQVGAENQEPAALTGDLYPSMRPGLARQGQQIYRQNGCFYCHSQQVRPKGWGSDVAREWGGRKGKVQSVERDYLYDNPVMLGDQRVGPDLANLGLRQTNDVILLAHIYNPQATMPGSVMPPYRFLFEKHKLGFGEKPSTNALPAAIASAPAGYEILPSNDALALVAYLQSLHSESILVEAPGGKIPPGTNSAASAGPCDVANAAGTKANNSPAKK